MSDGPAECQKEKDIREVWRNVPGDAYSPSIQVYDNGNVVRLSVGGKVVSMSADKWMEAAWDDDACSKQSNLVMHAEHELRRAGMFDKNADYGGMIAEAVMKLVKTRAKEGHSGMSHSWTLQVFNLVANYKTLTPITNLPGEWSEVGKDMMPDGDKTCWQNRRRSSLFSHDGGKTYYDIDEKQPRFRALRRLLGLPIFKMHTSAEANP